MRRGKSVILVVLSVAIITGSSMVYNSMNPAPDREDCIDVLEIEYNSVENSSASVPSVCFTEQGPMIKELEGAEPGDTLVRTENGFRVNSTRREIVLD